MENRTIIIKRDGDMWCAHRDDFVNLQESVAEFGVCESEALHNLLAAEMDVSRNEMLKDCAESEELSPEEWSKRHNGQSIEENRKREVRAREALRGLI